MTDSEFKAGDIVIMKSGSPAMILIEHSDSWGLGVGEGWKCWWFVDNERKEEVFPTFTLMKPKSTIKTYTLLP